MAITLADFNKIWASTSPLTPYSFSEANYKRGWNFVGSTPPARQMWDSYMKASDEKHQWLYNNKLSLSGGTMTGVITSTANIFIKRSNDAGYLQLLGGTAFANGASLTLLGIDHSAQPGQFMLRARDASIYKDLLGKPDGTLTWNNNDIALVKDVLPLAGGTMTGNISFNKSDARIYVSKAGNDSSLMLAGGAGVNTGAYINLFGQSHATNAGEVAIISRDTSNTSDMRMKPDGTLMWKSQAILYGPNVSYNNNGYFIIRSCNTAIQWRRQNISAGASYTWTFDRPFGADNQYTRFVSSENACTVTATATTMTVTNNGSTTAEVNMLAIGIMAS